MAARRSREASERTIIAAELEFLKRHTWQDIYARPEFATLPETESEPESFHQITERLLNSKLACALVAGGYINDYFSLYISMYYGKHLRIDALNFMVHAIDRGEPDMLYPLEAQDVEAILRERGDDVLSDRSVYNVSLLDHLLATDAARASRLVEQIASWGDEDATFAKRYLTHGANTNAFIAALAPLHDDILFFLFRAQIEEPHRLELMATALGHLDNEREYYWDDDIKSFIFSHYTEFDVLTGDVRPAHADRAMAMIATMGLRLPSVAQLNAGALTAAAAYGTYVITEVNLISLTCSRSIALNDLRNTSIYGTVLSRLRDYVDAVRATAPPQPTVTENASFLEILTDIDAAVPDDDHLISDVAHLAAEECRVNALSDAPIRTWPTLTADRRTKPTASNLLAYLDEFEEIDENVASLLAGVEMITDVQAIDADQRAHLATAILNSRAHLADPVQRARLAHSLELDGPLDVSDIVPETGQLAGLMIELGIVEDNDETFASPLIVDWETREFAIERSRDFGELLDPGTLPAQDVGAFFNSSNISDATKKAIMARLGEYLSGAPADACNAAGRYALQNQIQLDFARLEALREGGVEEPLLVELVAAIDLSVDNLRTLLRSMSVPYFTIADHGRQLSDLPDDEAHRAILKRLQAAGVVSNFREHKEKLRVSLRRS